MTGDAHAAQSPASSRHSNVEPRSEAWKAKVAEAYYQAGHTMMVSPKLSSRVKYRGALKHFRSALKYNPKHAKAQAEKKMIEDIYKSMGRPVPS